MRTIFFDGRYVNVNPQIVEAFTPGVFKVKGVFETMLGVDGVVMDCALHIRRLKEGLSILGINPPTINPSVLKQVLNCNQLATARVRVMVWEAPAGQAVKQTHLMMVALPYKAAAKKSFRVCLLRTKRAANDALANVKSLDYELFAQAYAKAQESGFDEALLLNSSGHIFEASRANIFWIKDKILYTPPLSSGCLNGITRQQVIKQAKSLKTTVHEVDLTPAILKKSDAAFLTNSLIGIKPVDVTSISNIT